MAHASTTQADCAHLRALLKSDAPSAPVEFFDGFDQLSPAWQRANIGSVLLWQSAFHERPEILSGLLARGARAHSPEALAMPLFEAVRHWAVRLGKSSPEHRQCRRLLLAHCGPVAIIEEWQRAIARRVSEGFTDITELQGEFLGFFARLFPAHYPAALAAVPAAVGATEEGLAVLWTGLVTEAGQRLRPAQLDLTVQRFPFSARLEAEYSFWRSICERVSLSSQSPSRWFLAYIDRQLPHMTPAEQEASALRLFRMCSLPKSVAQLYSFAPHHPCLKVASQSRYVGQVYPHLSAEHAAAWEAAFGPPPQLSPSPPELLALMKESGSLHVLKKILDTGIHPDYVLEDGALLSTWAVSRSSAEDLREAVDLLLERGSQLKGALPLLRRWNAPEVYARAKGALDQEKLQERVRLAPSSLRSRM